MKVRNMTLCALFAALLAVCAWLSIPVADISFTMQTFGVFLALGLLGGKRGTVSILIYLLLGAVGLPVFTGFRGGIGVLLGVTGGYIAGFLASGLVYWLLTVFFPGKKLLAMIAGLAVCYAFGTGWFMIVYMQASSSLTLGAVLIKCVLPYLLPDTIKLCLALFLTQKLKRFVY